jgi:membrane protein required for colicin V production
MIDVVFVILMVLAAFKGFRKGFTGAVFSFAALFIGMAAAVKTSAVAAVWLQEKSGQPGPWWPVVAFVLVFLAVSLVLRMAASIVEKTLEAVALGWANRLSGFLLYAIVYTLLFSVALYYYDQLFHMSDPTKAASRVYAFVEPWGKWTMEAVGNVMPAFRDLFKDIDRYFEQTTGPLNKTVG